MCVCVSVCVSVDKMILKFKQDGKKLKTSRQFWKKKKGKIEELALPDVSFAKLH